jgi:hypothetical protein
MNISIYHKYFRRSKTAQSIYEQTLCYIQLEQETFSQSTL